LVLANDFPSDKGEELFCEIWVELAVSGELPQTAGLFGFSSWIARGQSVLGLQFADCAGTPEPLRQYVDDCGIDIIDAVAQVSKARRTGISRIHHHSLSFSAGSRLNLFTDEPRPNGIVQ
jgi:hypothetical protein